ncbi:MAG TPA: class I tRNA ligase family protein, partial [Friedmanniella sp.]
RRIGDVFDVWFDSGSMPYAAVHYPFENAEWFEHHYPGDFIVEHIGQTRGWFYTMHVLATALFDRPAFSSCISHGIVLGSDGLKMSKSLRNYPDVSEVFDRDGADAMRWFLMSSPILRGGNLVVTEQGIREGVRQTLIPLWNAYYFFTLYANAANGGQGYEAKESRDSEHVLDRYILGKLDELVAGLTTRLDALDVAGACDAVRGFLEVLSNWYIRRSRDRFWAGDSDESHAAFDTLWTVLETTTRAAAPLLPLVAEEVWRGLTGGRSVHLTDWPALRRAQGADDSDAAGLTAAMDRVREVCSTGSALRKAEGLRVRLPLRRLTVVAEDAAALAPYVDLVRDELNVRSVELTAAGDEAAAAFGVRQVLQVNARAAGPRLGRDVQLAIKGAKSGDWSVDDAGVVTSGGFALVEGEYALLTQVSDAGADEHRAVSMLPGGGFVVLDTEVTPELAAEGLARDVVRAVQQARRDAGLDVGDRIALVLGGDDAVQAALGQHRDLVGREVLASSLQIGEPSGEPGATAVVGADQEVQIVLRRA